MLSLSTLIIILIGINILVRPFPKTTHVVTGISLIVVAVLSVLGVVRFS